MSGGWTVATYLELASIIECATAVEGSNFETRRLMPILKEKGFDITEEGLKGMLARSSCFGGRGPQKQRGCPLLEDGKCTFIPFPTWLRDRR